MDKATYKKLNKIIDIVGVVLIIALVLITFIGWINAPEIVPTHYNFNGEVDGYGSKNTMFILLRV